MLKLKQDSLHLNVHLSISGTINTLRYCCKNFDNQYKYSNDCIILCS